MTLQNFRTCPQRTAPSTGVCSTLRGLAVTLLLLWPRLAAAGGSGMPYEAPLQRILDSMTGPVAKTAGVIAIVITGLTFAFGDGGGVLRRLVGIVFGLSIAFSAATFFLTFFGFAGGLAF
jgi:type IV secretion system protein TrbC